jgi:hypothetical protein
MIARDRASASRAPAPGGRPRDGDWFPGIAVIGADGNLSALVNGKLERVDVVIDQPLVNGQAVWLVWTNAGGGGYVVAGMQ